MICNLAHNALYNACTKRIIISKVCKIIRRLLPALLLNAAKMQRLKMGTPEDMFRLGTQVLPDNECQKRS